MVTGFENNGATLDLSGGDLTKLPAIQTVAMVRVGGDNITVNGSSDFVNGSMTVSAPVNTDPAGTLDRIVRGDGKAWDSDSGFAVGQQVTVTAEFSFPNVTFARSTAGDTITRNDGGNWSTDGFAAGQTMVLSGTTSTNGSLTNNGSFTIAGVSTDGKTLILTAANTVVPTVGSEPMTVELTGDFLVTGFATTKTTNDTLLLAGSGQAGQTAILPRQAAVPMTVNIGSPLVVYGDTTQDGVWYAGKSYQASSLGKFSGKPMPHMDNQAFTMATPGPGATNPIDSLSVTLGTFDTADGTFGTITRAGGSWVTDGYKVDGLVTIDGVAVGEVKTLNALTLTLAGLTPAFAGTGTATHTVKEWNTASIRLPNNSPFDPGFVTEGLITLGATYGQISFARSGSGDTITRLDGGSFITDGFAVGETIAVSQSTYNNSNFTITGVSLDGKTLTLNAANSVIPTPVGGSESARITIDIGTVAKVGSEYPVTFAASQAGDTITRTDTGSWITDNFVIGQTISITGTAKNDGNYEVAGVTAKILTLTAKNVVTAETDTAAISGRADSKQISGLTFSGNTLSRAGGSWLLDGFLPGEQITVALTAHNNGILTIQSISVDGKTLTLTTSVASEVKVTAAIGWGALAKHDTLELIDLQPGFLAFLHGNAASSSDARVNLTSTIVERNRLGQSADFFVFPLANQYTFNGNDVIDAHNLFAGIPDGQLPTVGITAYGGAGDDTIIGSQAGDHLAGGSGNDTILGERGQDHIYGDSGFNVDVITRVLTVAQAAGNSGAPDLDPLTPGGNNLIYGEAPGVGVTSSDVYGDNNDVIFGAFGDITQATDGARDTTKPLTLVPQRIETTLLPRVISSQSRQVGGNNTVYGNGGDDILIGGPGNDALDGGTGRDLVFGDDVTLTRGLVGRTAGAGLLGNYANLRFETLSGTQIYSTGSATDTLAASLDYANGLPQADPRGHANWGDYQIKMYDTVPGGPNSVSVANSFGNDYIAGGPNDDMLFGEAGSDVIQGDGSIDYVAHLIKDLGNGIMAVDPTDTKGGRVGVIGVGLGTNIAGNPFRDVNNALNLRPSFDGASDGQDYIEGNAGNDILFGNQNQDDLVGGNSDMFSLNSPTLRPDGSDLIFGGSGNAIALNAAGDATVDTSNNGINITTNPNGHANDADNILGDNGDIIRLVGVNGIVAPPVGSAVVANLTVNAYLTTTGIPTVVQSYNGFLRFNYDGGPHDTPITLSKVTTGGGVVAYDDTVKIVVRADRLLDYSPGGPDFNGADPKDSSRAIGDIGAADEIHGESGDDVIYGQVGNDWLYGEGQNDTMIGGYGNDWMSGGTGDDGMLGDDGRIFVSRNSLSATSSAANYNVSLGEPLYGVTPLLPTDGDPKYSNGNALNEYIYTPGNMQTDTINVSGVLKYTVDITPFSADPNWKGTQPAGDEFSYAGAKPNEPNSDGKTTMHYDDIMFGGLGNDEMHGGSGDDAISGAEALPLSYAPKYGSDGTPIGLYEIDYYHPFNPGNVLAFNPTDPDGKFTHPKIAGRTGEFALYDENDPLREILLNADGTASKWAAGATPTGVQFFLNFNQNSGVYVPGGTSQQNGGQTVAYGAAYNDGSDAIFGDNGNDWLVGGTGNDHLYGGWGNDLLNAVDDQTVNGGLNNVPVTQPTYEDRAYGGAGKDVLIANTGGDRLIDWVGEYNSYLVPFSEFGMATVSRTLQPGLQNFLYAESLSDGVDPTRFSDLNGGATPPLPTKNDPNPGRNGEPAGELGLVLQQDTAWHGQTGAPTDPQAGNIPGTQRDVLRSANFTGNSSPTGMFAAAGTWSVASAAYLRTARAR
ncbi:Ca2+-binding RTX toxin-like protein [Bradyrhizobium sp. JR3.5]